VVDGAVSLRAVNRRFKLALPEDHVTTLAGYLLREMGRIPSEGESFISAGIEFRVKRMEERRIEEIEMNLSTPESETK
jgi:putative hemolysin